MHSSNKNDLGIDVPKKALTHAGKFHADDVFSAALLKILNPNIEIKRTYDVPDDFYGIVYDIGGGEFDHHQEDAEIRENDIPYAAFGLIWRKFAPYWLKDGDEDISNEKSVGGREARHLDETFVQPLDYHDNTGSGHPLAEAISTFNVVWDEDDDDTAFYKAVDFAMNILNNRKKHILAERRAKTGVEKALEESEDHIVVLPEYIPWKMTLSRTGKIFVVYPSQRGGYSAQHISLYDDEGERYFYFFPEEWGGKKPEELKRISGVETLTFCHNNLFMISAETKEDAIKACEIAIEEFEKEK